MTSLPIINQPTTDAPVADSILAGVNIVDGGPVRRLPRWLKRPLPQPGMAYTSDVISDLKLETVCESAKCPNRTECWSQKTATFMIGGNVCTRPCGFCSVPKGKTERLELDEPERVAEAAARLGLQYVVITSVTRDDLKDGGAEHWYRTVLAVREKTGAGTKGTPPFIYPNQICTGLLESLSRTLFLTSVSHASRSASERTIRRGIETDCTSGSNFCGILKGTLSFDWINKG